MARVSSDKMVWAGTIPVFSTFLLLLSFFTTAFGVPASKPQAPIHPVTNERPRTWLLLGSFPSTPFTNKTGEDGSSRSGYDTDFLLSLGGEAKAQLADGVSVSYTNGGGTVFQGKAFPHTSTGPYVDFISALKGEDFRTAYAFCYIQSPKNQGVTFYFGSDDGAKVWVNGVLVHKIWTEGRGVKSGEDHFSVKLKAGLNPVLVKVENNWGGWGFDLLVLDEKAAALQSARQQKLVVIQALQEAEVRPKGRYDFMFRPGPFPVLEWKDGAALTNLVGPLPLKVRWFDADAKEVATALKPGRYGAYVESRTRQGIMVRRALTFYCMPRGWSPWWDGHRATLEAFPGSPVDPLAFQRNKDLVAQMAGAWFVEHLETEPDGAILMAHLAEAKQVGELAANRRDPYVSHGDHQVKIKRALLGMGPESARLPGAPAVVKVPALSLREGSDLEAGFKAGTSQKLAVICREWNQLGGTPFVTLVARRGIIVYHEALGSNHMGPYTLATRCPVASITKAMTATLVARYLDAGLIDLDAPIGKVLPDFPTNGPKAITLRHCLSHTTGFTGHQAWGGVDNPWFDNAAAMQLPLLEPGAAYQYNGKGFSLTGKVLEMVGGLSIESQFRRLLFEPLGIPQGQVGDLGGSGQFTARELAVVAQLWLGRGAYGNGRYFGEQAYTAIMPTNLSAHFPAVRDTEYGIGMSFMRQTNRGASPEDSKPFVLSKNMFGHGSATSCIFRMDPDEQVMVIQVRTGRGDGKVYDQQLEKLLRAIEDGCRQ